MRSLLLVVKRFSESEYTTEGTRPQMQEPSGVGRWYKREVLCLPGEHTQVKAPLPSIHTPVSLSQGSLAHSSISTWHRDPGARQWTNIHIQRQLIGCIVSRRWQEAYHSSWKNPYRNVHGSLECANQRTLFAYNRNIETLVENNSVCWWHYDAFPCLLQAYKCSAQHSQYWTSNVWVWRHCWVPCHNPTTRLLECIAIVISFLAAPRTCWMLLLVKTSQRGVHWLLATPLPTGWRNKQYRAVGRQMLTCFSCLSVSLPVNPEAHRQVKESMPSTQVASFAQGLERQLSTVDWQVGPEKKKEKIQLLRNYITAFQVGES